MDPIIKRIENKLEIWKHKHLSFIYRACLINSILPSLLLFFWLFASKIMSILTKFLWGSKEEVKKITWVSWKDIFC